MKWEKVRLGHVTDSCLGKMLDKEKTRANINHILQMLMLDGEALI